MATTSTDLTVDEGSAHAAAETGLPLPEPQAVDGPIFKQVWQAQTDALGSTDAEHAAETVDEAPAETGDDTGGTHSA